MAKSAQDYIAEGRALQKSGLALTPFVSPKSWQQRAVNQGFMEAFEEACDANAVKVQQEAKDLNQRRIEEVDLKIEQGVNELGASVHVGGFTKAGTVPAILHHSTDHGLERGRPTAVFRDSNGRVTGMNDVRHDGTLTLGDPTGVTLEYLPDLSASEARTLIPQAVIEHINFLHRKRAMVTDEKHRARLLDKSIALKNKWSRRVFAAYGRGLRTR